MRLEELLRTDIYHSSQILAGADGLNKPVETVNIMDAPDIIHFLKPNELLLTNGYFIQNHPDSLLELIHDMHLMKCSGIAIKTKRFGISVPDEVIAEANRLRFPIVEISELKYSLGEILQRSTSLILDNKNEELQYALQIHKSFCDMTMKGKSIPDIVATLSKLLASPIILLNSKRQLIANSRLPASQLKEVISRLSLLMEDTSTLDPSISFCFIEKEFRKYSHVLSYPVHTYRHEGWLLSLHESLSNSDRYRLTMEQAANVIGMEMTKAYAVKERSRRYKNEFFSDLIEGYFVTEHEALHSGKKFGLKPGGDWVLLAARLDEHTSSHSLTKNVSNLTELSISERDMQYELIKWHLASIPYSFIMFTKNDSFGLLLAIDRQQWDDYHLAEILKERIEYLFKDSKISLSIGIGNPVGSVLDIGHSFTEAAKALQLGYHMKKTRFVESYQSKDVAYLFRMLPQEELRQFYEETFRAFNQVEAQEREELLRTLNIFYDTQCQLVETSKQLYVHRNTVVYRLEKCEKITGLNLKEPMISLRFRIAFAIEAMLFKADT
ncbi:PucR family transcriptional regulator ligand-binding domain-containing protein [Neobacillus mesonae]|nr:PucR family transcriptional regulator ligand-binding domain-containing protein [Neobacillus mesonae]